MLQRIEDPREKPSWTRDCRCGAFWRFYEEDVEVVFPGNHNDLTTLFITCAECGHKIEVTFFVKPYSAKLKIELAEINRKKA